MIRSILFLCLFFSFISANAQIVQLMQVLKSQSQTLIIEVPRFNTASNPYEIKKIGSRILFYKTIDTIKKVIASVDFSRIDPTAVITTQNENGSLLNFVGDNAIRYYDSASNSYKIRRELTIRLDNYPYSEKFRKVVKNTAYSFSPRKDIKIICLGDVRKMPYFSVRIADKDRIGVFKEQHAKFEVQGKRGILTAKQVPLGTRLSIRIYRPRQGTQVSVGLGIIQEYKMPATLGHWNELYKKSGRDPVIKIKQRI